MKRRTLIAKLDDTGCWYLRKFTQCETPQWTKIKQNAKDFADGEIFGELFILIKHKIPVLICYDYD